MKRSIFTVIGLIFAASLIPQSTGNRASDSVYYTEGSEYCCKVNDAIVLELPEGEYDYQTSGTNWAIEKYGNLIWISPKAENDALVLKVRNEKNMGVLLKVKSTQNCNSIRKIIVLNLIELEKVEISPPVIQSENPKTVDVSAKESPQTPAQKSQEVIQPERKTEHQVLGGVSGGLFRINNKNHFGVNGDLITAIRTKEGYFIQGAATVNLNGFCSRFGESIGFGMETHNLGLFVFADALQTKIQDYDLSVHFQLRPAVRYKTKTVLFSGFYAMPFGEAKYTGVDDPQDPDLGIFNKAIPHFGFEFDGLFIKNVIFRFQGLIGSSSIYKISGGLDWKIRKNFFMTLNARYYNFGDYPLLLESGYGNALELNAGLAIGLGKEIGFKDIRNRIVYPVDYPLVVNVKQKKKEEDQKKTNLYIKLSADPVKGYAPLAVSFFADFGGGQEPYKVELFPMWKKSQAALQAQNQGFIYPDPGTYTAKAFVTDKNGQKAESNEVTITVLKSDKTLWNVVVISGPGGSVTPGTTQVEDGEDSPVFNIQPNSGYEIDYVLLDGKNEGKLASHQFKAVHANHELQAYFKTAGGNPTIKYTITATAGPNGTISPSGSVQVEKGGNQTFICEASSAAYDIDKVLIDGSEAASNQPSPYTYTFTNVQADHTISVTFKIRKFTIHVDFTGPGHTEPGYGDYQVNYGSNFTINNVPDSGSAGDYLTVDGIWTAYQPSYTFTNVTANHNYYCRFKTSYLTFTWNSINGNRRYIINGVDRGFSGSIQVNPNDVINIVWTTASGRLYTANNVHAWDSAGHEIVNQDVSNGVSITVVANTWITDTSPTKYWYETNIREGQGSITPTGGEWKDPGDVIPISIQANPYFTIERIVINGAVTYIDNPTYSFTLTMNEDKLVEVYFRVL